MVWIILIVVVLFILWKKTSVFDSLKGKKTENETATKAENEEAKRVAEEKAREEKIANCSHEYSPYIYEGYKNELFRVIDESGFSLEKCSKCENIIKGEKIAQVFCKPISAEMATDIIYEYNGEANNAGKYGIKIKDIHYLVANKHWPALKISKGDVLVELYVESDNLEKTSDYPVGTELSKALAFFDDEGNLISDENGLNLFNIDLKSFDQVMEEKGLRFGSLSNSEIEEVVSEEVQSHSTLLRIPKVDCELQLHAFFPELLTEE